MINHRLRVNKFPMIVKRHKCKYRFDGLKCINFSKDDYLSDNDKFLMFFLERLDRLGYTIVRPKLSINMLKDVWTSDLDAEVKKRFKNKQKS